MLHLAITLDQNLYIQLFALLSSIIHNKKDTTQITIHCIATGLSETQISTITKYLAINKIAIKYYEINSELTSKFYIHNTKSFTMAAYYRLFFPQLINQNINRLLYIDIDTLVLKDLTDLYTTNLDDFVLGAVYDNYVKTQPLIGITKEGQYFNSGVLLIDCNKWRTEDITQKCIDYLLQNPKNIIYVDQCVLNAVIQNKYKKLDIYNNMMYSYLPTKSTKKEMKKLQSKITILHFTLHKPWKMMCMNPFRKLYHFYLKKSPMKKENTIIDFEYSKLMPYLKFRILELYLFSDLLQKILLKNEKNNN
ncbi:MAG: glycosyltransferase family 8 protein [Chitinophagales bacterium]|nr:glycosyltransferase family 8 protein [Chitinophagales bacterium]